ncbi:hypothetical protein [Actinomarinicola tropica]|uniref:Uncharacterized protein n=1 Tax=Actinomarinicola tropica TaxID=2789776 RepID=A0A5Q2RGE2_9ACTN|nr:hypothetical protein [Actinomarinicola tropica]QGG93671.1 hypothetical protein GH723_00280 [Actinomarinicola tropica]
MTAPTKLAAFALLLLVVLGASFGVGRLVAPEGADEAPASTTTTTAPAHGHGGDR